MEKNKIRGYIVGAIILVVFSVVSFVIPFVKTGAFWAGYIFGVIAIAAQLYFFKISFEEGADVKSKLYGFPIAKLGAAYLVVQLVISIIEFISSKYIPAWVAVIINILLLGIVAIGSIATDVMRDEIVKQDVKIKTNVQNMRELQSLSLSLVGMCQDEELVSKLQDLADEFKHSDPVSSEKTLNMEEEIKLLINEIQRALIDGDNDSAKSFCMRTKAALAERNRVCKLGK